MKIDFHTHPVLIQEMVDKYPNYARMARDVFQIGNNFQPLETFYLQMDVAGIDRAVLLPIDCERARGDAVSSNEQVAELCSISDRFIGFASVDPLKEGAAKELEHAVKKMGMKGLKLDAALQDFELHDSRVYDLYAAAEGLNIPVLLHTGMSWAPGTLIERGHPMQLEEAIVKFPKLNFVLAHWGWPWVWEATALTLKYPNVYLDTSCLYYDSPKEFYQFVFSKQIPTTVLERSLRNRMLFGSNYPRVEIKNMVHALATLGLTEGCLEKIYHENPGRLLGIN